jgi:hypothetical protein
MLKTKWLVLAGMGSVAASFTGCGASDEGRTNTPAVADGDDVGEVTGALTIPEGSLYQARINASGKCATVESSSQADGARVIQLPCSQVGANSRWDVVSIGGDVYQLRASHSGKCLNVSGGSTADGAKLIQWRCEGGNNERFHVEPVSGGFRLRAVHSGKCTDLPGANTADGVQLQQFTCNGTAAQIVTGVPVAAVPVGAPFPGLSAADVGIFNTGKTEFVTVEEADEGLGPIFNEAACGNCHTAGAVGGGSNIVETRFGNLTNGVFDPLTNQGGSLRQNKTIGAVVVNGRNCNWALEQVPSNANRVAGRRTTPLFGLGLVDLLPDSTFTNLAASEPADVRGRVSTTTNFLTGQTNAVGKFGWKGQNPTLFQFSSDAYLNEMGITNRMSSTVAPFGTEQCPNQAGGCALINTCDPVPGIDDEDEAPADGISDGVQFFFNFMKFINAPPRGNVGAAQNAGETVFSNIGCASCHTASFTTPNSGSLPQALRSRTFHPYSDFLLHDMGASGDQIVQGAARAQDMRTAPLWGLRFVSPLFHDGRAASITAAIQAHQGQGSAAASRFNGLGSTDKSNLLAFLNSL